MYPLYNQSQSNNSSSKLISTTQRNNEDPILGIGSRKKKYSQHFCNKGNDIFSISNESDSRAKSEERKPCQILVNSRSRSAEPAKNLIQKMDMVDNFSIDGGSEPLLSANINHNKENWSCSEYRAAFNWPKGGIMKENAATKRSVTISDFNDLPLIKSKADVLFSHETSTTVKPFKPITKTEYRKKFRPFSTYVYVAGDGWKKSKDFSTPNEKAKEWYSEVAERNAKANEFRSRSQFGHPIVSVDHLEEIYKESSGNLWTKDRSIAALALATTQLRVVENKLNKERQGSNGCRTTDPKPHSSRKDGFKPIEKRSLNDNKQLPAKSKSSERSKIRSATLGEAKKFVDNDSGKVSLKLKKTAKPIDIKESEKTDHANRNGFELSDDQPKSPRPNSLDTNGDKADDLPTPKIDCPVKTTEIKSPEEITGVRSPSPEEWAVKFDGGGLNWTDTKSSSKENAKLIDENNSNEINEINYNGMKSKSGETVVQSDDIYGPLSI